MAKKVCLKTNSSDRISALPEPLKHHIISYLSTKEAVRTSILSSDWRQIWTGLTAIEFDGSHIGTLLLNKVDTCSTHDLRDSANRAIENFFESVSRVLRSITKLEELKFCVPYYGLEYLCTTELWLEMELHPPEWLNYAASFNVKKLDLELGEWRGPRFWLPNSVLCCKSITNLRLSKCKVDLSNVDDRYQLPSLRELWLRDVDLHGTELDFERLLVNCISLETFTCIDCRGLSKLKLLGLPKLERLEAVFVKRQGGRDAHNVCAIETNAPNLLEFSCEYKGYDDDDSCCGVEVSRCKKMKSLKLCGVTFNDDNLSTFLKAFPVLETLAISMCNHLRYVVISNQQLGSLIFEDCKKLLEVKVDSTDLQDVSILGDCSISR